MTRIARLTFLFSALLLGSCANPPPPAASRPLWNIYQVALQLESDPPGARIEYDDGYMGTTPCTIQVPAVYSRQFTFVGPRGHTIRAIPVRDGDYAQTK